MRLSARTIVMRIEGPARLALLLSLYVSAPPRSRRPNTRLRSSPAARCPPSLGSAQVVSGDMAQTLVSHPRVIVLARASQIANLAMHSAIVRAPT
jgi:hypothetical protein